MSVDQLYSLLQLARDAQQGEGWETFGPTPAEEHGSARKIVAGRWCARVRGVLQQSAVPAKSFWPLPEVLAEAVEGAGGSTIIFKRFRLLARHAPGDATVEQSLQNFVPWYRCFVDGEHAVRILVQSGYPALDQCTMIVCPTSSNLGPLAFAATSSPLREFPGAVVITQSFLLPPGVDPSCAVATMPGITSACTQLRLARCPCMLQTQQMMDTYYIILTLKKCSSGSPFLPRSRHAVANRAEDWHRLSYDEFELTKYLRRFLSVVGLDHVLVYGTMHGFRIAPYMALVSRQQWEHAFRRIDAWLRTAGAAYRMQTGATSAPKILEVQQARFVERCLPSPGLSRRLSTGSINETLVLHHFLQPIPAEPGLTWL
ncbi:unnamed protein product [Symbiodinium sp. CCMP2456]|nr:unnamed protein product [Symbiodinium sp. CCMP2456]